MSQAHIEQFCGKALKDPVLLQALIKGGSSPDAFVRKAVAEGKAQGFTFTEDEARAWIVAHNAPKANGELSDNQLEAVAGGKGRSLMSMIPMPPPPPPPKHTSSPTTATAAEMQSMVDSIMKAMQDQMNSMNSIMNKMGGA